VNDRPLHAEAGPGRQSVWDYPRPPAIERVRSHIEVVFADEKVADSKRAIKVMETSHPPVYYIPIADIVSASLELSGRRTACEFKGEADYYHVRIGERIATDAAWRYRHPTRGYEDLADCMAFYPQLMDACYVDGEQVTPQPGAFYGGWITSEIVGPFKGAPGTLGW
jgi:uncharacterized protein (DUF427 family)